MEREWVRKRVIWGSLSERENKREREKGEWGTSMLLELLVCQRSSYHSVRFSLTTSSSTLLVRYSTLKRCARSHRRCRRDLVELSCRQLSCISYVCRSKSSYRRRKSRNPVFVEKKLKLCFPIILSSAVFMCHNEEVDIALWFYIFVVRKSVKNDSVILLFLLC